MRAGGGGTWGSIATTVVFLVAFATLLAFCSFAMLNSAQQHTYTTTAPYPPPRVHYHPALESTGLLFADALNMVLRITYSLFYTCRLFHPLRSSTATLAALAPPLPVLLTCAAAAVGGWASSVATLGSVPLQHTAMHMVAHAGAGTGIPIAAAAPLQDVVSRAPLAAQLGAMLPVGSRVWTMYAQYKLLVHMGVHAAVAVQLLVVVLGVMWVAEGRMLIKAVRGRRGGREEEESREEEKKKA